MLPIVAGQARGQFPVAMGLSAPVLAVAPAARDADDQPHRRPVAQLALGAGHAFKFTPAIGRILAELAVDGGTGDDISAFAPRLVTAS